MGIEKLAQRPIVFILGRGRSGTTMLRLMLNAHPDLAFAPEAMFILMLYNKYAKLNQWDKRKISLFLRDLWLERRLSNWNLDRDRLKNDLLALEGGASFAKLCKAVYWNYAVTQGKEKVQYFGDKNPHYCLFANRLIRLFPDSKFIHMVRDYRDNIISYRRVKFDLHDLTALAYRWNHYNREISNINKKFPDRFILLRFEDLVAEPEYQLKKVCQFLEVKFNPTMLEYYKHDPDIPQWGWHQNVSKPLDPNRVQVWQREMKRSDILLAEFVCNRSARKYGYTSVLNNQQNWLFMLIKSFPGTVWGWMVTTLEKKTFYLPLYLRAGLVNLYRKMTGSLESH